MWVLTTQSKQRNTNWDSDSDETVVGKTSPKFASDFVGRETASSPYFAAQNVL